MVQKTNAAFSEAAVSIAQMEGLLGEITAASNEQAQGIEQINLAVSEMDRVVQQNSANAEESASSSEEMSAQADHMKDIIEQLMAMIGGASGSAEEVNLNETTGAKDAFDRLQRTRF